MNECIKCDVCAENLHHWIEDCDDEGEPVVTCKHCDFEMRMPDKTEYIGSTVTMHAFYFVCEGCGTEGALDLEITRISQRVHCPEDCGAVYVLWNSSALEHPDLMCVRKPVFAEAKL